MLPWRKFALYHRLWSQIKTNHLPKTSCLVQTQYISARAPAFIFDNLQGFQIINYLPATMSRISRLRGIGAACAHWVTWCRHPATSYLPTQLPPLGSPSPHLKDNANFCFRSPKACRKVLGHQTAPTQPHRPKRLDHASQIQRPKTSQNPNLPDPRDSASAGEPGQAHHNHDQ